MYLLLLLALVPPASAQDGYPKAEVYGGFSLLLADMGPGDAEELFGLNTSVTANFHKNVGITADLGAHYSSVAGVKLQGYEVLFGPRFSARQEKLNVFAHALFGLEHARAGGFSDTGFAMAFGGGLDRSVNDRVSIRAIQIDYIPNRFSGEWFHDIRIGAGVVIKFGY